MRTVDLFAGCGGLSKGFEDAGFDVVAAFEFWPRAAECYAKNFDHPVFEQDLSDVDAAVEKIRAFAPDVIIGGPPCQDFSHAGKRIEAARASLTDSYAEIIHPHYFVMENVDRARTSHAFQKAHAIFKVAGYGLTMMVLDACRCGAPQKRKRFFCIGAQGADDDFLRTRLLTGQSEKDMTLRDYFGDTLDFEYYYRHPRNYNRRAVFSIDEPAPTMRGVNRPVPKGYPGHPNDACKIDEHVRALTTLERALIQTFPADYHWVGTKTDVEQMIGNAVPVKLAEYVGRALAEYIAQRESYEVPVEMELHFAEDGFRSDFRQWLMKGKGMSRRSANDVVSRVTRADAIYPMKGRALTSTYFQGLSGKPQYTALSACVRSQLKRSVILYCEYLRKPRYVTGEDALMMVR